MEKLKLKRPEVEAKYELLIEKDRMIHANGYSGQLSNVNLTGAEHLVSSKSGLLSLKKVKAEEKKQAEPPK